MNPENEQVTIIGIDCATNVDKVGVAIARVFGENRENVQIEDAGVFTGDTKGKPVSKDDWTPLVEHLAKRLGDDRVLLALDAPLGWPDAMRAELAAHAAGKPLATGRQRMFSRLTDRFVKCRTGKKPLDIGAEKIAKVAHWTLGLLEELRDRTGHEIPLAWNPNEVQGVTAIEVYPALALLGLAPNRHAASKFGAGYKSTTDNDDRRDARRSIWQPLASRVGELQPEKPPGTDHEIDAVLCVQIAHEFLRCRCVRPVANFPTDVHRREGWIWFAQDSCLESE